MGVGEDWADKMAEEKEAARLRKKELRELRLGMYKVSALALLACNKLTQILNFQKSTRRLRTSGNRLLYLSKRIHPVNNINGAEFFVMIIIIITGLKSIRTTPRDSNHARDDDRGSFQNVTHNRF